MLLGNLSCVGSKVLRPGTLTPCFNDKAYSHTHDVGLKVIVDGETRFPRLLFWDGCFLHLLSPLQHEFVSFILARYFHNS